MKKKSVFKRLSSIVLVVLFVTLTAFPASAKDGIKKEQIGGAIIETTGNFVSGLLPDGENFIPVSEYKSENFFEGTGFNNAESGTGKWSLGSAEGVLTPDDLFEKKYYTGGGFDASLFDAFRFIKYAIGNLNAKQYDYAMQDFELAMNCFKAVHRMLSNKLCCVIKQNYNDMCVRAVSVDDGTGRGATAIAVVDCIGLANSDVREIRSRVTEKLGDDNIFSSITVAATHCHSCIDTQGIWTNTFAKIIFNFMKCILRIGNLEQGYDTEYMEFLYDKVADTVIDAYNNMEQGSMTFASKNLSDAENDYFYLKKRDVKGQTVDDLNRFVFTPDDKNSTPTIIVNTAAHPYYTSIATAAYPDSRGDGLSGDFVYYMGETICNAGYNFMFFNGSVANVYTKDSSYMKDLNSECRDELMQRYGNEMGKMVLAMTKTENEIKSDPYLYDAEEEAQRFEYFRIAAEEELAQYPEEVLEEYPEIAEYIYDFLSYYPWYENWEPAEEINLDPVLNTAFREVHIKVTNPLIRLAGKLSLTSNQVLYDGKDYYIVSEVGYMELGGKVKIALMPGEVFPDLQVGGGMLTAEKSYSGEDFGYPCIRDIFGEDTIVFGLANDAIGYIVSDNDYVLCFDGQGHYHEFFSLGKNTASSLIKELMGIKENISSES